MNEKIEKLARDKIHKTKPYVRPDIHKKPKPPSPKRRVHFRGETVTVCIAAISKYEHQDVIVCCTDTRVSLQDWTHGDTQIKIAITHFGDVHILMAGSVSAASEVISYFDDHLDIQNASGYALLERFQQCADGYRTKLVERYLRGTWDITLGDYKQTGANHLPEAHRDRIADELSSNRIDFECELIFVCFDGKSARLFVLERTGRIRENTATGFAVIGSGALLGTTALYARGYTRYMQMPKALYTVFEAKKISEAEVTVGPDTFMLVVDPKDSVWVHPQGIKALQREFEILHPPLNALSLNESFFLKMDDYKGIIGTYTESDAEADDSPATTGEERP